MRIVFIEIQNFRKLKSVRIDFADKATIFVGANNSGKTSAMTALGHFLIDPKRFYVNDLTLCHWNRINKIGQNWEKAHKNQSDINLGLEEWTKCLPTLDLWLEVENDEIHHVSHLLPTLDWTEGMLGVRLRYEPTNLEELHAEYIKARLHAEKILQEAKAKHPENNYTVSLWPRSLMDFLDKKLKNYFSINSYTLDPDKQGDTPQILSVESEPIEQSPFYGLIKIDEISAHRGFSDPSTKADDEKGATRHSGSSKYKLSEQMKAYYYKHIDPSEFPEVADIEALQAIETAQSLFDEKLKHGFENPINELQDLNYPGVTDPKVVIATKIRPIEALNHDAALQYEVIQKGAGDGLPPLRLPEQYNGLGYQNLISMVFRLMSFRDSWVQIGKAQSSAGEDDPIAPLHLVIVEEPEAHLHVQVQQVFIRIAYDILRKRPELGDNKNLTTQLIVSTHSSHIAHECKFSTLRYFRRLPAINDGDVPTTKVINLSDVFGEGDETPRFVTRYLKTTHCDLFFADATILVEGPAERMLVPHFIEHHFPNLRKSYITLLEIGGSHAHRLRSLIEHLGLSSLIITDIDSQNDDGKTRPIRGAGLVTNNDTLKKWLPQIDKIDELLDAGPEKKIKTQEDGLSSIRVAYQNPIQIAGKEVLSYTFEDALVLENIEIFKAMKGNGLVKKFNTALNKNTSYDDICEALYKAIDSNSKKADFALDVLFNIEPKDLMVPSYMAEGLQWLEDQLNNRNAEQNALAKAA